MKFNLRDEYAVSGKDFEEFKEAVFELDSKTKFVKCNMHDIKLLSYCAEKSNADELVFEMHTPGVRNLSPEYRKISMATMTRKGVDKELLNELYIKTHLMLIINDKAWFTSGNCISTLASRCQLGGDRIFTPTVGRDAYIAETFGALGNDVTLVVRHDENKVNKVFAVHSKAYGNIKQAILPEIVDALATEVGESVVKEWTLDQDMTSINLEFPEKAKDIAGVYKLPDKIIPGLYLGTSDTGDSSVTARGFYSVNGVKTYSEVYKRRHSGTVRAEQVLENVEKTIFSKYTKLPERLCELMSIDIPTEALPDLYEEICKRSGIKKELGKKVVAKLVEELSNDINPTLKYTAYNVAITFLELPRRFSKESKAYKKDAIERACGAAPYLDYQAILKKVKVPAVLLTA